MMNTNSPEFTSLLAAAIWWRDYAMNLSKGRREFPASPYPALRKFTPAPPPGVKASAPWGRQAIKLLRDQIAALNE